MSDDTNPVRLHLTTADGVGLEGEVATPSGSSDAGGPASGAVVLAHPHPLHGGSMSSLVTSELFRLLPRRRIAALRFNFRGVGASEGDHDQGDAERHDVVAAIDELAGRHVAGPLVVCGWSFGADVSLTVTHPAIAGWVAIAAPLRFRPEGDYEAVGADHRPKLLLVPEHDEFRAPASAADAVADWTAASVVTVPGADHYLVGRTDKVARLVASFVQDLDPT